MSSLRNAVKRITHKERSQPRARAHLGILEKHSDYQQRAADYHAKERHVQRLRQAAAQRNPDEFYFGMHRAVLLDGKHVKTDAARQAEFNATVGDDTIRLLKDQDLSYIRTQKQKDAHKVKKLQASLHLLDDSNHNDQDDGVAPKRRKHTIFVDSAQEAQDFDVAQHFDTLPETVGRTFNRPRLSELQAQIEASHNKDSDNEDNDDDDEKEDAEPALTAAEIRQQERATRKLATRLAKARESSYRELQERSKRVEKLSRAEAHLVTEKAVRGKGRKRKIQAAGPGGQPAVYKWRRKRLR